ncbi:MAG: hypothetical protein CM15mP84_11080 [Cellvibrionales bacterium]|nr:MAG: hypothetical protein CM15mP84_11080 [Cellvibrionales bacterium]
MDYAWSGWIGIGINRMPQLGELAPNIRYIQAYSGHGVAPTHIMAKITAESIAGESDRFNVMAAIPTCPSREDECSAGHCLPREWRITS